MFLFREYHAPLERFFCTRHRGAFGLAWAGLIAALFLLAAAFWWMGAPISSGSPWDTFMFLDGGWRLLQGQVPHKDFYLIWGELPIYLSWLGMKLGHPGEGSLTFGNIFVMLWAGVVSMLVLRRRTSAVYAGVISLFIAVLAVTPRALSDPYDALSYAMIYNRYGEAFLTLLGAMLFLPPLPDSRGAAADWLEAVLIGFCMALLLISKLNYFAAGVGFCALACLRGRNVVKQMLVAAPAAALFYAFALSLAHTPFSAVLHDYRIMMAAQDPGGRSIQFVVGARRNLFYLFILWLLIWEYSKKQSGVAQAWPYFALVSIIFVGEMALVACNAKGGEYALLPLGAFYCAELLRRQPREGANDNIYYALRNTTAAVVLLVFLAPTFGTDLMSIRHTVYDTFRGRYVVPETFRGTRLADFRFQLPEKQNHIMSDFVASLNDGMELVGRHKDPQMRLAAFTFANPFHLGLDLVPQQGGVLCWFKTGITTRSRPPLQDMVGNANYVIMDTGQGDYLETYGSRCQDAYGTELPGAHWQLVEETKHFRLYKVPVAR